MRRNRFIQAGFALGLALFVGACSESPTAPDLAPDASYGLLDGVTGLLGVGGGARSVTVVERRTPLLSDEVVSKVIGSTGGVIVLPRSGLTVNVPRGALRSNTRITVTAPKGNLAGYHFAPHGLRFRKSVTAVQDLNKTELGLLAGILSPFAAYFEGDLAPRVSVLEILRLNLLGLLRIATFQIDHFSGYVIATDRSSRAR